MGMRRCMISEGSVGQMEGRQGVSSSLPWKTLQLCGAGQGAQQLHQAVAFSLDMLTLHRHDVSRTGGNDNRCETHDVKNASCWAQHDSSTAKFSPCKLWDPE